MNMNPNLSIEYFLNRYKSRKEDYTWDIYQPIPLPGFEETFNYCGRKCIDRLEFIIDTIAKKFDNRKIKILDIGCNMGYFCFELAKLGHDVTGIDIDQKRIDELSFLNTYYNETNLPQFKCQKLDNINVFNFIEYDLVICCSVIHHLKNKLEILNLLSKTVPCLIVEMDGKDYGEFHLKSFYYDVEKIGETNDPYGSSTKKRYTWFCNNTEAHHIKKRNNIFGRGTFKIGNTAIKREYIGCEHTWIKTSLLYEKEVYEQYNSCPFFTKMNNFKIKDKYYELNIDYVDDIGIPNAAEIYKFYQFLNEQKLFIVDFVRDMFLFNHKSAIKVIDLESIINIDNYKNCLKKKDKPLAYDTYDKQIQWLLQHYKLSNQ